MEETSLVISAQRHLHVSAGPQADGAAFEIMRGS